LPGLGHSCFMSQRPANMNGIAAARSGLRGWPPRLRRASGGFWANGCRLLVLAALAALGCGADNGAEEPRVLEDMEFVGFVDANTGGEPSVIRLSDYSAAGRPGVRILMLNAAAGWCSPCMREAAALSEFAATYEPRGVAILTAVFQDQNGDPADTEFVRTWVETFNLAVPVLIDTTFQMGAYVDVNTMPANVFVDAETSQILTIATGAETGNDPMQEYRELLDYYLQ
jgi:thiol-disulfide isomerase/thioredoxin